MNYYNDNDPSAVAWLRELIKQKLIPPGDVDERSIMDVTGADLKGYIQCHFFAGIAGWSEALRLAGWPTTRPVWTGSCPCQPFSSAGKRQGTKDERHLWPEFYRLIKECKPPIVFGEQVESAEVVGTELEAAFIVAVQSGNYARANKLAKRLVASKSFHYYQRWIDGVRSNLEAENYAVGFAILGAHSVNAPHIRQRLYWVADSENQRYERSGRTWTRREGLTDNRTINGMGDSKSNAEWEYRQLSSGMEYPAGNGRGSRRTESDGRGASRGCSENNFWSDSIPIPCRDGKQRRISPEPSAFPLAHGIPGRVAMLRGFGNAIVPQVAAEFIKAYMEIADRGLNV